MYIEQLDVDEHTPHIVTWASRFRRMGTEPAYHVDLSLVPCDDLVGALDGLWRPSAKAVSHAKVVAVPVELLALVELGTVWLQGRYLGLMQLPQRKFKLDSDIYTPSSVMSDARIGGNYLISPSAYALGAAGLNTPLTAIPATGDHTMVLFHPVALMQALCGGSSALWAMLSSGAVDHPEQGAYVQATATVEATTLTFELQKSLSVRDDWVRAATWHAYPESRQVAGQLFRDVHTLRAGKPAGYIWVDVPALKDLTITARGIPLPAPDHAQRFLVLNIDAVSYALPYDRVILHGHGTPNIHEIKGEVRNGIPAKNRRRRYVAEDIKILKPGGLKSGRQQTAPRLHRITFDVGAVRAPYLSVPDKTVHVLPRSPPPKRNFEIPEGMIGPGIQDDEAGTPNARIAGAPASVTPDTPANESSVEDLVNVMNAVITVAGELKADLNFLTMQDSTRFKLAQGIVGEFPTNEGQSPLTRFAWLRRSPEIIRVVLVAELYYRGRYCYVFDCEKRMEQIAIGILHHRNGHRQLSETDLNRILKAAIRTKAVWQLLNGKDYVVHKLLHAPAGTIAARIARVMRLADAPPEPPAAPQGSGQPSSQTRAPEDDTRISVSP